MFRVRHASLHGLFAIVLICSVAYIGLAPRFGGPQNMPRKFLGATPRRWIEYLAAILIGNAIYYLSLLPHLPRSLQHQGFQTDWGLVLDFAVCVAVYGLIRLGSKL